MIEEAKAYLEAFNKTSKEYFAHRKAEASDVAQLLESIEYSFFNGGKRFRPMLCYAVGEALGLGEKQITPWAMAVETIHTYSLIHDDLPCMDNDDERRGQPTNHKKFSEDMALLAGDSLLTESFLIVAKSYPEKASSLVELLAEGSGLNGMIRGQVLDLGRGQKIEELNDLINLHQLKTGQLISLCFTGPALIAGRKIGEMNELGLQLGLAFQVKDDLLDIDEADVASFIQFLGKKGTQDYLESLTEKIFNQLKILNLDKSFLRSLIEFNFSRVQ